MEIIIITSLLVLMMYPPVCVLWPGLIKVNYLFTQRLVWLQTIVKSICLCHCACWPNSKSQSFTHCAVSCSLPILFWIFFPTEKNRILVAHVILIEFINSLFLLLFSSALLLALAQLSFNVVVKIYRRSIIKAISVFETHLFFFSRWEIKTCVGWIWSMKVSSLLLQIIIKQRRGDWQNCWNCKNLLMKIFLLSSVQPLNCSLTPFAFRSVVCHMMHFQLCFVWFLFLFFFVRS